MMMLTTIGESPVTLALSFVSFIGFVVLLSVFRGRNAKLQKRVGPPVGGCSAAAATGSGPQTDVIIVGAGVAGAALAYSLAKDGRRVRVIERDLSEPERMSGEYLQPGGYLKLIELGLEDCTEKIDAQKMVGIKFYKDGKDLTLTYPLQNFSSDVAARSFHNGRLVQRLREKAASLPNVRLEQGTVLSLIEEQGVVKGIRYKTKNGEEFNEYASLTVVCDGCTSNLRRSLCSPKVDVPSHCVGFMLENCQIPFADHGHIILGDPIFLFYRISSVEVRCLIDVPTGPGQKMPSLANGEMAEYLRTVVAPQVPPEFYESFVAAIEKGNLRTLPIRTMPATPQPTPGALLVGDAFNMRSPFTAGGMTVALSDVVIIRDLLRPLQDLTDSVALCKYLEPFYTLRKPGASVINSLAGLLYSVFCASPDEAHTEIREALFGYLSLGGECANGTIALLGGLNPRPLSLAVHMVGIAVYALGRILLPFPTPKRTWLALRVLKGATGIVLPLLKAEGLMQMFSPSKFSAFW